MNTISRIALRVARHIPRGYWPIVRFAANRDAALQDLSIDIIGASRPLRADMRETVFIPLWRHGLIPHQVGLDKFFRAALRSGDCVFDIGANVGYTTLLFSDIVAGHGKVVGIEPAPRTFRLLSRSLSEVPNVILVNCGISDSNGMLEFYVSESLDLSSLSPIDDAEAVQINTSTLDDITALFGTPQLIKVDVEGHEEGVFRGGEITFSRNNKPMVAFEALNVDARDKCINTLSRLSSNGYIFFRLRNDGAIVNIDNSGTSDFLAIPEWVASERLNLPLELRGPLQVDRARNLPTRSS